MKRTLAWILAALLLCAAFACVKPAAETPADTSAETEAPAVPTEEPAAKPTEAVAGVPQDVIEERPREPILITDLIGREITVVPGSYQRVVCIGAGALRMFTYIADVGLLCGVEDIDNLSLAERPKMFDASARPYVLAYGDAFSELPSCGVGGPNAQAAEAEKILACDPDIVISEYEDVEKEDALQEQLGVPVVTLRAGYGGVFDEPFKQSMRLLGVLFDRTELASALLNFVEAQEAEIMRRTADIPEEEKPTVYICGLGNWGTTNHLMTAQNYNVFGVANVKNVIEDLEKNGIQPIEEEKFVALGEKIDIMFIDAAAVKNIKPLLAENPGLFDTCKAWQNGEVYLEMAYNAYYTNFETALINAWFIAKTVYPDRFADIDLTEKANAITKAFLGLELYEQIVSAPASFGGWQKIDTMTFFD